MGARLTRYTALLRGINVGGRSMLPMAQLRQRCSELGWQDVRTYIQSGNVVFTAGAAARALEKALEAAIQQHLAMTVPVLVRSAAEWTAYVRSNPFPAASGLEPNRVMLALSKLPPAAGAAAALQERASPEERVLEAAGALWIHYGGGAGRSKLTPALLDRAAGSPVTTRNWRTVLKLEELLRSPAT